MRCGTLGNRITISLTGVEDTIREYDEYLERVETNVRLTIDEASSELKSQAAINAPKRTTQLANSIQRQILDDGFAARVYTNVPYAAAQNFGIPGNVQQVSAHQRTITQAWGRQLDTPVTVNVRPHVRRMNIPATLFFTNAIETVRPKYLKNMQEALEG